MGARTVDLITRTTDKVRRRLLHVEFMDGREHVLLIGNRSGDLAGLLSKGEYLVHGKYTVADPEYRLYAFPAVNVRRTWIEATEQYTTTD